MLVYIHGGKWATSSSTSPQIHGHNLASGSDIIVITLNYRLGAFGFLSTNTQTGKGGLNGVYDQLQALYWIQENIEYFGGDSRAVTLMGTEAGSASVCYLSVMPLGKCRDHMSSVLRFHLTVPLGMASRLQRLEHSDLES